MEKEYDETYPLRHGVGYSFYMMGNVPQNIEPITNSIIERGDLAHLALFLWAASSSALLVWSLKELVKSNHRFNDFVHQLHRLNQLFNERK